MNPLITYEYAMARMERLHREADKARLARTVRSNSREDRRIPARRRRTWRRRAAVGCC